MSKRRFYFMSGSPFAWRVQLALEEKGLSYEAIRLPATMEALRSEEHLARSPHGKVPALEDGKITLYESTAILEYLDDAYPEKPLLPIDPARRAEVRIEELECVNYYQAAFAKLGAQVFFTKPEDRDQVVIDTAKAAVSEEIGRLDARMAARGWEFICAPDLTRADTTWIPFIELAGRAGLELSPAHKHVLAWRELMRSRPSYKKSYPPHWAE